jgi:hypothetical protein
MSGVSHFQRFTQKENHVTNNTLLALRHVYRYSPRKLALLLNVLLEEEVPIGLEFQQQLRGTHSVPDAVIIQQSFGIFIEAKLGEGLDSRQVERHINSIKSRAMPTGASLLVGLTTQKLDKDVIEYLRQKANAEGIRFFSVTYSNLASELRKLCADHEQDLIEIVEDYRAFLATEGLLSNPEDWMVVFPCGTSWRENAQFGVYYEPSTRSGKWDCKFLGVYHNKCVSHVGELVAVAACQRKGEILVEEKTEFGVLNETHRSRIKQIIEATEYYDLKNDLLRYYVVQNFVPMTFSKTSPGGMRGLASWT